MNYYSFKFDGVYPVGACGVVIAENMGEALTKAHKLIEDFRDSRIWDLKEIVKDIIILDGDY